MAQKKRARRTTHVAGIAGTRSLGRKAKGVLDNPLARDLLAAALIHVAVMLVESQSARGSTTQRLVGNLGDAGRRAGKFGATMSQALDKLRAYWSGPEPDAVERQPRSRRPTGSKRTKRNKRPNRGMGRNGSADSFESTGPEPAGG